MKKYGSANSKISRHSTIISANKEDLLRFIAKHKNIIAKPANAFGGTGVFHIEKGNTNTKVVLETLTERYNQAIVVQKYIPESKNGDKRILLLDGKILGALLRMHEAGEHRNNFFAGGKPMPATINAKDKKIIGILKLICKSLAFISWGSIFWEII